MVGGFPPSQVSTSTLIGPRVEVLSRSVGTTVTDVNPALTFVLVALATYRICAFVIDDHLVAPITERVQVFFEARWMRRHPEESEGEMWRSKMAFLLSCYYCLSIWVAGAIVCVVNAWFEPIGLPVIVVLAASGVTGFLSSVVDHD